MDELPPLHRYGDEYHRSAGGDMERIRRAIGPDPLPDARRRLPPLHLPPEPPEEPGPRDAHEFVVDIAGPVETERAIQAFSLSHRTAMGFPRLWGRTVSSETWTELDEIAPRARLAALSLAWDLASLLAEGSEAARELALYTEAALRIAASLGVSAAPRESPAQGAERAARLLRLRERFGRSIEMRLMPSGRPFPARQVWRSALALGLEWGNMDLFHWHEPESGRLLFSMSAVGQPGYFLPERVEEGQGIAGIALGFELPHSPAPVQVFDRMALALVYLREQMGGNPLTREGRELDGESLADARDELWELTEEMRRAGMPAGSREAARFF